MKKWAGKKKWVFLCPKEQHRDVPALKRESHVRVPGLSVCTERDFKMMFPFPPFAGHHWRLLSLERAVGQLRTAHTQ